MLNKSKTMKKQILSLVFFMLATTLMVVQGNSKKIESTNQTEVEDFENVAQIYSYQDEVN